MTRAVNKVIGLLRRGPSGSADGSDALLLRRFAETRDEEAFAQLVRRHGPMVWGVCRRLLLHQQETEDAFQTTFLVLACKAGSVGRRGQLANWLFGVARRAALSLRRHRARRARREHLCGEVPDVHALPAATWDSVSAVLDEELARLPSKYRLPILLCGLEGMSHAEAGRRLDWPVGTVAGRLSRGRALLRTRLQRRGIEVTGTALAVGLAAEASATVSAPLVATVASNAVTVARTGAVATTVAAHVATLTRELLRAQALTRTATITAVVLGVVVAVVGTSLFWSYLRTGDTWSSGFPVHARVRFTGATHPNPERNVVMPTRVQPSDDPNYIRLPADPGAAVLRWARSDPRPDQTDLAVTLHADGRVVVETKQPGVGGKQPKTFVDRISAAEVQELMRYAVRQQEMFDIDRASVIEAMKQEYDFDGRFRLPTEVDTSEFRLQTADRDYTLKWDQYGAAIVYFRDDQRVKRLLSVQQRLQNLSAVVRAGGKARVDAIADVVNKAVGPLFQNAPAFTTADLVGTGPAVNGKGGPSYTFERGDKFRGPEYFGAAVEVPEQGKPRIVWVIPKPSGTAPVLKKRQPADPWAWLL